MYSQLLRIKSRIWPLPSLNFFEWYFTPVLWHWIYSFCLIPKAKLSLPLKNTLSKGLSFAYFEYFITQAQWSSSEFVIFLAFSVFIFMYLIFLYPSRNCLNKLFNSLLLPHNGISIHFTPQNLILVFKIEPAMKFLVTILPQRYSHLYACLQVSQTSNNPTFSSLFHYHCQWQSWDPIYFLTKEYHHAWEHSKIGKGSYDTLWGVLSAFSIKDEGE